MVWGTVVAAARSWTARPGANIHHHPRMILRNSPVTIGTVPITQRS